MFMDTGAKKTIMRSDLVGRLELQQMYAEQVAPYGKQGLLKITLHFIFHLKVEYVNKNCSNQRLIDEIDDICSKTIFPLKSCSNIGKTEVPRSSRGSGVLNPKPSPVNPSRVLSIVHSYSQCCQRIK